jgi:hypothetical protein
MQPFLLLVPAVLMVSLPPPGPGLPLPYVVGEYPDVAISYLSPERRTIVVNTPKGGSHTLGVGPKTWIFKADGEPGTFTDLRVGQRIRVRFIIRGGEVVTVDVLPPKAKKATSP